MEDTAMKDSTASEPAPEAPPEIGLAEIKRAMSHIEKSVVQKEPRLMGRALRQTQGFRKKVAADKLVALIKETLPDSVAIKTTLLESVSGDGASMQTEVAPCTAKDGDLLPESEIYVCLFVTMYLIDQKLFNQAKTVTTATVARLGAFNRRSLDRIASLVYFYYSWSHECLNVLDEVRSKLLALLRTATLRHDNVGQEMLLNLLLRNFLHYNLYDLAEKLRSKTEMPESRSNQQYCRYLYYLGRIRAIQLEYTDAKECLLQASRKTPQAAVGFRIEISKWMTLVRLLLGEVPERSLFRQKGLIKALEPYFAITNAVRIGNLDSFRAACEKYNTVFQKDKTVNLINRLRKNVIRTGLRRINLAYSCISLDDVAQKLCLGLTDDVECIVAKAIRDGAIEANLDHAARYTYNEAVKAMRYPPDAHKKGLESAEARKERQQQEQELAKHIAEEEEEEDFP